MFGLRMIELFPYEQRTVDILVTIVDDVRKVQVGRIPILRYQGIVLGLEKGNVVVDTGQEVTEVDTEGICVIGDRILGCHPLFAREYWKSVPGMISYHLDECLTLGRTPVRAVVGGNQWYASECFDFLQQAWMHDGQLKRYKTLAVRSDLIRQVHRPEMIYRTGSGPDITIPFPKRNI